MATKLGYWIVKHPKKNNVTLEENNTDNTDYDSIMELFDKFKRSLLGASYEFIEYIGKQEVGDYINHAILAKQVIQNSKSSVNAVIIKIVQKKDKFSLYGIDPIFENVGVLGGFKVDPKWGDDIPEEALEALSEVSKYYIGNKIEPIALLATRVSKGIDYVFAVVSTTVAEHPYSQFKVITVNPMMHTIDFDYFL